MAFHFEKVEDYPVQDSGKVYSLSTRSNEECALCFGTLITLFGEPLYMTRDMENMYAYHIKGVSEEGHVTYLDVYSGSSGPSIGAGDSSEKTLSAARALDELIQNTRSSDYAYTGYYTDAYLKVECGVRLGKAYYKEDEADEEEIENVIDEMFEA